MKGETVHAVIDNGAAVATKENLGTPEIQALLFHQKIYNGLGLTPRFH
jgi:hypothetical protein